MTNKISYIVSILLFFVISVPAVWGQQEVIKQDIITKKEITILIIEGVMGVMQPMQPAMGVGMPDWKTVEKKLKIDPDTLAQKFKEFLENMEVVFKKTPKILGDYMVDEIELHLSINAEGGFDLIGKATVGTTTGINVTLKRRP